MEGETYAYALLAWSVAGPSTGEPDASARRMPPVGRTISRARDAITLFEAHHRVAQYREQPITLQYPDGSRLRRYTPDFEVILETGEALLVEIKPDRSLQDPEVRHKLQRISEHLIRMGQPFVVLSSSVIRREPRQSNLRQILQQAPHVLPTRMRPRSRCVRGFSAFPWPWPRRGRSSSEPVRVLSSCC